MSVRNLCCCCSLPPRIHPKPSGGSVESAGGQLGVFPPTDFAPLRASWKALKSFGPENSGACKVSRGLTILGDRARQGLSPGTLGMARTHEGFSESGFKVGTFPKMTPSQCQPDRIPTGQRQPSPPPWEDVSTTRRGALTPPFSRRQKRQQSWP